MLKYITALWDKLEATQTDSSLTLLYLCLILTKLINTGTIVAADYPKIFHCAIYFQYAIVWDNFFCGKLLQEWLVLFDDGNNSINNYNSYTIQYIWGANMI